jgi:glutathione S-transferase
MICEYLDSLHGGAKLFPQQPERRWQALRWHALGYIDFRFPELG